MSSKEIHVVAILTAKPGKMDEVVKLFDETAAKVHANEPGTLMYYAVTPKKGGELIIVERYKDVASLNVHGNTPHFKAWSAAVAPLVTGPSQLRFGRYAGGFQERSSKL